ncbi:MAG: hypothetical protein K0Q51_985 [Rickettsiaceae bacterium]|jgi:hypothetical protein|nr:hypothetical protein [Rickettsiaceae bacterium]
MKKILLDELKKDALDITKICELITQGHVIKFGFITLRTEGWGLFNQLNDRQENIFYRVLDKATENNFIQIFDTIKLLLNNTDFRIREQIRQPSSEFLYNFINIPIKGESLAQKAIKKDYFKALKKLLTNGAIIRNINEQEVESLLEYSLNAGDLELFEAMCLGNVKNHSLLENYFDLMISKILIDTNKYSSFFQVLFSTFWSNKNFLGHDQISKVMTTDVIRRMVQDLRIVDQSSIEVVQKNTLITNILKQKAIELLKDLVQENLKQSVESKPPIVRNVNITDAASASESPAPVEEEIVVIADASSDDKKLISTEQIESTKKEKTLPSNIIKLADELRKQLESNKKAYEYALHKLGKDYTTLHLFICIKSFSKKYFGDKLNKILAEGDFPSKALYNTIDKFFVEYIKNLGSEDFYKTTAPSKKKYTANQKLNVFEFACKLNDLEMVKILIETSPYYDRSNISLTKFAIKQSNIKVVKYLIEEGINKPNWKYVMFNACKYGRTDIIKEYKKIFTEDFIASSINSKQQTIFPYMLKGIGDLLKALGAHHLKLINKADTQRMQKMIEEDGIRLNESLEIFKLLFENSFLKDFKVAMKGYLRIVRKINALDETKNASSDEKVKKLLEKCEDTALKIKEWVSDFLLNHENLPQDYRFKLEELSSNWENMSYATESTFGTHMSFLSNIDDKSFSEDSYTGSESIETHQLGETGEN